MIALSSTKNDAYAQPVTTKQFSTYKGPFFANKDIFKYLTVWL